MSSPELSIILPVYNVDPWLCECLDSIQAQTFTDWEAILVDDGSIDFSGIFCDSYERNDSRFKVIHQKNAGVSAARNAGIETARGALLSFVDPDDFLSPNFYKTLVGALCNTGAEISVSFCQSVEENGQAEAARRDMLERMGVESREEDISAAAARERMIQRGKNGKSRQDD